MTKATHSLVVVKIGGSTGINLDLVADDVAWLTQHGSAPLVVHGGSALTNEVAQLLGHPPEFLTSASGFTSRRTDRRTLEIFQMVYCGQVNKGLVERLQTRNVNAIGLSGMDGKIWEGPRKSVIRSVTNGRTVVVRDDYTGKVERVNTVLLRRLMQDGYLPVLTPPAISYDGEAINVDGDRAAAQTAVQLNADALVILSNVRGLLRDYPDESSLIREARTANLAALTDLAGGRMKKKVLGAQEALSGGVPKVVFADGRVSRPIRNALDGNGTVFRG